MNTRYSDKSGEDRRKKRKAVPRDALGDAKHLKMRGKIYNSLK